MSAVSKGEEPVAEKEVADCLSNISADEIKGEMSFSSQKRKDYLDWEDYFMGIAFLAAQRSKDPRTQVGACIISEEKKIIGVGYNGFPRFCSDDEFPWGKSHSVLDSKHTYVCHAEMNAVLNTNSRSPKDCKIYVSLFPCNECAKIIIQSGIKEVIYMNDKNHRKDSTVAARRMFTAANVKCRQFKPKNERIIIDFNALERRKFSDLSSAAKKIKTDETSPSIPSQSTS